MLFPAFFTTSSIVLLCDKASIQSNNSIILISIHIFELNHHFFHWRTRQTGDKNLPSGQKWIYRELCNNGLTKNEMKTVHKSRAIFFSSDNPKLPLDSYCTFYHYTYFSRLSYNLSDFFFFYFIWRKNFPSIEKWPQQQRWRISHFVFHFTMRELIFFGTYIIWFRFTGITGKNNCWFSFLRNVFLV